MEPFLQKNSCLDTYDSALDKCGCLPLCSLSGEKRESPYVDFFVSCLWIWFGDGNGELSAHGNFPGGFVSSHRPHHLEGSLQGLQPQFLLFMDSPTHQVFIYSVSAIFQALCEVPAPEGWVYGDIL